MPASVSKALCRFAFALLVPAACDAVTLNIPPTHPRIWYGNPARLAQARAYFQGHPLHPDSDDYFGRALNGLINNDAADCLAAAHHVRDYEVGSGSEGFRDDIRGNGEDLLLEFDWCHDQLTADEITGIVDKWNGYMAIELADNLGNAGKEANNYWAGRTRNLLMLGIASAGDPHANAQSYIDEALVTRMGTQFSRWYANFGRGGVFPEGGDYGIVSLSYPILAFVSAADFGYDPYAHTNYYREAIYGLLYGSTPGPSTIATTYDGDTVDVAENEYGLFPFNDDEHFYLGGGINERDYMGDFTTYFGSRAPTSGNARHALAWQAETSAGRRSLFDALGTSGNVADLSGLPLDYFAPGAQVFDLRTSHDPADAMQVHLQLGEPGGIEHRHLDAGTFQVWRKGRWLSRESTGYANYILPFDQTNGSIDCSASEAHNALLFEGRSTGTWIGDDGPVPVPPGTPPSDQPRGLPRTTRLQHATDFAYSATDYADSYRNGIDTRVDWPYADKAVREFLFIRPLQALIVLDRMKGSSDSTRPYYFSDEWLEDGPHESAEQVRRSFIMHFETAPEIAASHDRLSATAGDQTSELITLIPATPYVAMSPIVRIVNEDRSSDADREVGQTRLELDSIGDVESYFLNVITGYDVGEAKITATLQDLGDHWQLDLSHPTRGTATVILQKGMMSTGGSVSINGAPAVALSETVQPIAVTDDGPVWEGDAIFANGFDAAP